MRVTQAMLSSHTLRYINQGYNGLARLQDQLVTGKKISRPSQDCHCNERDALSYRSNRDRAV
ncbi:hypothetical protein [Bacillus sp. JCM 19034]|uniref:hypothetical protein n=1 Tax=Bacillus sp. JCM 19034 TaxID=1481928 RepID=UPI001E3024AB|nr:hypothetical protein [Bacillus sp. JCM 19034]